MHSSPSSLPKEQSPGWLKTPDMHQISLEEEAYTPEPPMDMAPEAPSDKDEEKDHLLTEKRDRDQDRRRRLDCVMI